MANDSSGCERSAWPDRPGQWRRRSVWAPQRYNFNLHGAKTYGAASASKHGTLRSLGGTPIDYHAGPMDRLTRELQPQGVDYVFDAVGGANIGPCIGALRRGGTLAGFGFTGAS